MIVGINFTGKITDIENLEVLRRQFRFKKELRAANRWIRLQGITNSESEAKIMLVQADNKHRLVSVVQRRHKLAGTIYAFYVS